MHQLCQVVTNEKDEYLYSEAIPSIFVFSLRILREKKFSARSPARTAKRFRAYLFSVCVFCVRKSPPRAASHRYRYQLSLTLQGVCGNYILSILPSKRAILFIRLWHPIGGCGWRGGLGRDACIPGTSIYAIHQMLKSIQSQMKFFFSKSFLIG